MALPDLTPEQRAQALEKATQARRRRAEVKNALKARAWPWPRPAEGARRAFRLTRPSVAHLSHD